MDDFEIKDGVLVKYYGRNQTVVIPEGTTMIGEGAFEGNASIISIEMPSSICKIEQHAFARCLNLLNINLPDSITKIGSFAFSSCKILTLSTKELPQSLTDIGEEAFSYCNRLSELVFPSKLESIGAKAFFKCESLAKIKLNKNIKFIGFSAFGFTKIKEIFYNGTVEEFGAIKSGLPPEFESSALFPISDSSSGSLTLFGPHAPILHCKDMKDDLNAVLAKLQGLVNEIEQ